MTVKQLIEKLQEYPPDTSIVATYNNVPVNDIEVDIVETNRDKYEVVRLLWDINKKD